MKWHKCFCFLLLLCFFITVNLLNAKSSTKSSSQKQNTVKTSEKKYWYVIRVTGEKGGYPYYGSSKLTEEEIKQQLSSNKPIVLNDLFFLEKEKDIKTWEEWIPIFENRIYINPQFIISIMPLKDDPKKVLQKRQ